MNRFCKKCGTSTEEDHLQLCPGCGFALVQNNVYLIPIVNVETSQIERHPQDVAWKLLDDPRKFIPVPQKDDTYNVKIDGELNGVPTGKKIREKNEQLKKKVAGYSHEERNVRADVERAIQKKQEAGQALKG
jgi:RNA polymerase subunit RPABC4/transcription elongation factor Spt4